jgi:hypothetical protein
MQPRIHRQPCGSGLTAFATLALTLSVLAVALVVVLAMEDTTKTREMALLAEAKQNLHAIQLAIERFSVDNDEYPAYLTGGSRYYSAQVDVSSQQPFEDIRVIEDLRPVSDILLREGYFSVYPDNPFVKAGQPSMTAVHQMQLSIPGSGVADPLRNGGEGAGAVCGTRFGQYCTLMGQVLADARYPLLTYPQGEQGHDAQYESHAATGYPFWDIWAGDQPKPYLPGAFFYKSSGIVLSADATASAQAPVRPAKPAGYILGLYGPLSDKGKDIIGEEQQVAGWTAGTGGKLGLDAAGTQVWPWTRSTASPEEYGGSPYSPGKSGAAFQWEYGNPNGVRDAIVLVLTAGS